MQFQLMQDGFQPFLADTLFNHFLQGVLDQCLEFLVLVRLTALDTTDEGHLPVGVFETTHGRRRVAEIGGFQRPHQRGRAVLQQHGGQQLAFHVFQQVKTVAEQPTRHDMGLVLGALTLVHGITLLHPDRAEHPLLIADRQFDIQLVEPLQCQFLEALVMLVGRDIAIGSKDRVARVIVMAIEVDQVVVAKIDDVVRLTATVVMIGSSGEQVAAEVLP